MKKRKVVMARKEGDIDKRSQWITGTNNDSEFVYFEFGRNGRTLFDIWVDEESKQIRFGFWTGTDRIQVDIEEFLPGLLTAVASLKEDIAVGYSGVDLREFLDES